MEGVEMTEREMDRLLEKNGVTRIAAVGERFDPHRHQAMFEVPDPSVPAGTVSQVVQEGYQIGDRVLRAALVGVSKDGPKSTAAEGAKRGDRRSGRDPATCTCSREVYDPLSCLVHIGLERCGLPRRGGAQMAEHGTFHWNELNTRDVEKAKKFYEKTIGWTFEGMPMQNGTYWVAKVGDKMVGGIFDMNAIGLPKEIPEHWMSYLAVDDVDKRVAKAKKAGATVCGSRSTCREPVASPF